MLPDAFFWHGEHIGIRLEGATSVFTTRRGGISQGAYASLNLGRWTEDDPEAVQANRSALAGELGVGFAYGRQIHGTTVLHAQASTPDPPVSGAGPGDADGQLTAVPGVAPMVLTADCLPVAIAGGGAVAMLHAGWRGLAGGILSRGLRALRELAGPDAPLSAAIGPGAGPCCYEVSEEVHGAFADRGTDLRQGRNLDLPGIARLALETAGVEEVHDVALCTICSDPTLFFSHRRDRGLTGRQAGVAWLN